MGQQKVNGVIVVEEQRTEATVKLEDISTARPKKEPDPAKK